MKTQNISSELILEKANLILQLVETLNIPYGYEPSFKLGHKSCLSNRFLLSISKGSIVNNPEGKILDLCRSLDIPNRFFEEIQKNISDADFLHFGFEEGLNSCLYKVYLEKGLPAHALTKNDYNNVSPILLHLGFKWDIDNPNRKVLTQYLWYPFLSIEGILKRIFDIYNREQHQECLAIIKSIIELAARQAGEDAIRYLEVTEDANPRRSYSLNVHDAELRVQDIQLILMSMFHYYSIPTNLFQDLYAKIKQKKLGNLAGGIHRDGQDFFTVYYGVEGRHNEQES